MSEQENDLPEYPNGPAYRRGSAASIDGARMVKAKHPSQMEQCLAVVSAAGPDGVVSDVVAEETGIRLDTCRARLSTLLKLGKVRKLERRRMGRAGVRNHVWVLARYAPADTLDGDGNGQLNLLDAA